MTTQTQASITAAVQQWFAEHLPPTLFSGAPEISVDPDEILVVGPIAVPEGSDDTDEGRRSSSLSAAIEAFREDTRQQRVELAQDAEPLFQRRVSWGATCGDRRELFTTVSSPVMTRLRLPERKVLDTLVESGVARSRSHALAWCVRLVGQHEAEWLTDLRDALVAVKRVRAEGPSPV